MNLTLEELDQISLCRKGIISASSIGAIFGVFGGKIALGQTPSTFLLKSIVMGGKNNKRACSLVKFLKASVVTGLIVGAGVSVQQSFNYLKSQPTNLAKELQNFSELKKKIYRSDNVENDSELEDKMNEIYNKRISKLPNSPK